MKMKLSPIILAFFLLVGCNQGTIQEKNIDALLDTYSFNDSLYNRMITDPNFVELCDLSHELDALSFYPALDNYEQNKEALRSLYDKVSKYNAEHEIDNLFILYRSV